MSKCLVCDDNGFIVMTELIQGVSYEFIYYCTRCPAGEEFKYDGRKCKEKSSYWIPPIDSIMDVDSYIGNRLFDVKPADNRERLKQAVKAFTGNSKLDEQREV